MSLTFEWDEDKAEQNLKKHGVSFHEAKTAFNDPCAITIHDPDHSDTEDRYIDIGLSFKGRLIVVSYTERGEIIRIISSRKAEKREKIMKKGKKKNETKEMREEYDFSGGVQGKHFKEYRRGHSVRITKSNGTTETHIFSAAEGSIMLDPDVRKHFSDSETVNKVLRSLIDHN